MIDRLFDDKKGIHISDEEICIKANIETNNKSNSICLIRKFALI